MEDVVHPSMIAFHYWREWSRARGRNDWDFMYAMSAEGSALREQLGARDAFAERCRRRDRGVPGLRDGQLRMIRLDGPDVAQLFRVVGVDDRTQRSLTVERWFMLRGADNWFIHAVDELEKDRAEAMGAISPSWFDAVQIPEGFVSRSAFEAENAQSSDVGAEII